MRLFGKNFNLLKPTYVLNVDGRDVNIGPDYNLSAHLGRVIRAYGIDLVLDVGANEGQFGAGLRGGGYTGRIVSFEPVKATFDRLSERAASDPAWKVFNLALGARRDRLAINVTSSSDFSSMLAPNEFGERRFKGLRVDQTEDVEVRRLDDVIPALVGIDGHRVLFKTDTQGFDDQVVEGAGGLLAKFIAIVSELSMIPIYRGMKSYREMLAIYENSGFSVSGLYPVSRNKKDLSIIEMDCVLVNRELF